MSKVIILSDADQQQLLAFVDSARLDSRVSPDSLALLERELARAKVLPVDEVPAEVVTMNSHVTFVELATGEEERYTLVYPRDANLLHNRLSVLAPIGMALLGYREGDEIEWTVPAGTRRFRIVKVESANSAVAA